MKLVIVLGLLLSTFAFADNQEPKAKECLAYREYVTTLRYLRAKKDFAFKENDARKLADEVSLGCTNAGKRFIKIVDILTKAGVDSWSRY